MRFIMRIVGTWMLGMSVILLVMDGTKSLAASNIVFTSLGSVWAMAHSQSLFWLQQAIAQSSPKIVWEVIGLSMLQWPGWVVLGVPGVLLILAGRQINRR